LVISSTTTHEKVVSDRLRHDIFKGLDNDSTDHEWSEITANLVHWERLNWLFHTLILLVNTIMSYDGRKRVSGQDGT
jgi:hypothetical protein